MGEPWCSWVLSLSLLQPAECSRQTGGGCAECRGVACRGVPLNKHSHPQRCTKVVRRESQPSSRFGLHLYQIREFDTEHRGSSYSAPADHLVPTLWWCIGGGAARIPAEFTFWPVSRSNQGVWPRARGYRPTVHLRIALFPRSDSPWAPAQRSCAAPLPAELTFWPISQSHQGV